MTEYLSESWLARYTMEWIRLILCGLWEDVVRCGVYHASGGESECISGFLRDFSYPGGGYCRISSE